MTEINLTISCNPEIAEELMYFIHQSIDNYTECNFAGEELPFRFEYYEVKE